MGLGYTDIAKLQAGYDSTLGDYEAKMQDLAKKNDTMAEYGTRVSDLKLDIGQDQAAVLQLNDEIAATQEQKAVDIKAAEDKRDADLQKAECDAKNTKISLNKFMNDGMCGMGMGMGNNYCEKGAISLTVEELQALKGNLLNIGDSQETFESNFQSVTAALNEALGANGSTVTTGEENGVSFVRIEREDGSCVKIFDANGNGALDCKDYEFAKAMQQVDEIMTKLAQTQTDIKSQATTTINDITNTADTKIAELTTNRTAKENEIQQHQAEVTNYETVLMPALNNEIAALGQDITDLSNDLGEYEVDIGDAKADIAIAEDEQAELPSDSDGEEDPEAAKKAKGLV